MIHEILFALQGETGGIIIEQSDMFEISNQYVDITEVERDIINDAVKVGYMFKKIDKFQEWVD